MSRLSTILYLYLNILVLSFIYSKKNQDKCYVLALEGGGDHGAYQAGAIQGLVDQLPGEEVIWDVITGISVGSLNGAGMAIHEKGKEKDAAKFLLDTWRAITGGSDIYKNWLLGPLEGLLYKNSLYDTAPEKKLLAKVVAGATLHRKFIIGTTNFLTGAYEKFDEETLSRDEFTDAMMTSSAIPVLFPNVNFRGNTYVDGGVKIGVDIAAGINKCLDAGFTQENIVADVILCNSKSLPVLDKKNYHTLDVMMRTFEILNYDNAMRMLDDTKVFFPKVNFRYVVGPSKSLPNAKVPIVFQPSQIEEMIQLGIKDAKNVIGMGEGKSIEKYITELRKEKEEKFGFRRSNLEFLK